MPKVSQEHLDARRAQILEGARTAFAEFGYEGATVARLEAATGLSRGAIFHYFENKQDLFVELAMGMSVKVSRILAEGGVDAALRAVADENPEWLAVLIETEARLRHDKSFVERFQERSEDTAPLIRSWFEEQAIAGRLRDDVDWAELGRFVTSVINGLALRVAGGDPFDVDAMIRLVNDAIAPRREHER